MEFRTTAADGIGLRQPLQPAATRFKPAPSVLFAMARREADKFFRAEDYRSAAQVMVSFLLDEPGHIAARIILARARIQGGELQKAEEEMAPFRAECLGSTRLYRDLMNAYVDTGRFAEAMAMLVKADSENLFTTYACRKLLEYALRESRAEDAKHVLGKFFQKNLVERDDIKRTMIASMAAGTPESTADFIIASVTGCRDITRRRVFIFAIDVFGEMSQPDCAARVFREGADCLATDKYSWNAILSAYSRAGRADKAQQIFATMSEAGFASSHSYASMISMHARDGRMELAQALFENAWGEYDGKGYPYRDAYLAASMLKVCCMKEEYDKARGCYESAISVGMSSSQMHSVMIHFSSKTGHMDMAKKAFTNAVYRNETDARLLCEAVCSFEGEKEQEKAIELLIARCDERRVQPKDIARLLHDMQIKKDFDVARRVMLLLPRHIAEDMEVGIAMGRLEQRRRDIER